VLSTLSALAAGWVAVGVEQAGRAGAGLAAGVALRRLAAPPPWYLPHALQDGAPGGVLGWLGLALAGTALLLAVALLVSGLIGIFRSGGWLRSLALSLLLISLVWVPTSLAAAAMPGGGGPVAELYGALGSPRAGRWTALVLGGLLLWLLSGFAARRAVAVGRAWMRADARPFRRRLVRVVAGYPVAISVILITIAQAWMSPATAVAWGLLLFGTLVYRTA